MDRRCSVCGKEYWRNQQWIHDKCASNAGSSRGSAHDEKVVHAIEAVALQMGEAPVPETDRMLATFVDDKFVVSRHGKYRDPEKRKEYRKNWARIDRARKRALPA